MNILITGIGGPAGLAVVKCLRASHHIVGVDMNSEAPLKCRTHRFYTVPPGQDSAFIDALLKISRDEKINLMIPTVDEELLPIASDAGRFRNEGIQLFISPPQTIETCQDKYAAFLEFSARSIPTVRTCLPSKLGEANLSPPLLVKPRVGRGGRNITILESPSMIEKLGVGDSFIIQEFAPGVDYDGVALIMNNELAELRLLRKTVLEHGNYGNALETAETFDEDVLTLLRKIIDSFSLDGPVDIDARRMTDGKPVALEINPRAGAHVHKASSIIKRLLTGKRDTRNAIKEA